MGSADADFQRTLARQMEQRQALNKQTQASNTAQAPKAPAPPAPPANGKPVQASDSKAAEAPPQAGQPQAAQPAETKPAAGDQTTAAKSGDSDKQDDSDKQVAVADPASDLLALVASMKQAIAPLAKPADAADAATAQEIIQTKQDSAAAGLKLAKSGAAIVDTAAAGKARPGLVVSGDAGKTDGAADSGDFAAGLEAAQAKAGTAQAAADATQGKAEAGKLQLDQAQLSALKTKEGQADATALIKDALPDASKIAAPVQQAALHIAEAAAAIPADKLNGRVGTPAWDQQLGQKIVWMVGGGDHSATLTLNPPDLGPLQVVLKVTNEQTDAAFTSSQPEVRQALEAALPRLREIMSDAGIQFGSATVSAGTQEQQNQANTQARFAGNNGGNGRGNGTGGDGDGADGTARTAGSVSRSASQGMVDTFA